VPEVSAEEAKKRLSDLIAAAIRGEAVYIKDNGRRIVQLTPVGAPRRDRQPGSAKGLFAIADDFDAPLEDFREYTE
jgi:antitoxin (DNA-binding transcriptional repressor) of toxin-antitoxin stability system